MKRIVESIASLAEHMIAAGEKMGFTREQARTLASRTALGAAKMLAESPDAPQDLRRKVTSPGGTTEATAYDLLGYETGAACLALGNYHNAGPRGRVAAETVSFLTDHEKHARTREALRRFDVSVDMERVARRTLRLGPPV